MSNWLRVRFKIDLEDYRPAVWPVSGPYWNGAQALDIFKANRENIERIITDHEMPEMTGLELAKAVREIDKEVRIVMLSGNISMQKIFLETIEDGIFVKNIDEFEEVEQEFFEIQCR